MRKSKTTRTQTRKVSPREIDPRSRGYFVLVVICGCILAVGFFFAARLHFTSMEFGFKNSELRKQLEDLEAENRRLLLAREVSLSPGEIKRVAKNMGFREVEVSRIPVSTVSSDLKVGTEIPKSTDDKPSVLSNELRDVKLTAYQRPVKTQSGDSASRPEQLEKPNKRTAVVSKDKDKKESAEIVAKLR